MQAILAQAEYDPEMGPDELVCSSVFSLLYDLHPGLPLHISPAGPVPLQRVVLMSTGPSHSDGAGEFLGSVACSGSLLVGSADFVVLETVPFVQGTIETSTDVFVLPADANFLSTAR